MDFDAPGAVRSLVYVLGERRSVPERAWKLTSPDGDETPLPDDVAVAIQVLVGALSHDMAVLLEPVAESVGLPKAADILGMDQMQIGRVIERGELPAYQQNGFLHVHLEDLIDYRHRERERREAALERLHRIPLDPDED